MEERALHPLQQVTERRPARTAEGGLLFAHASEAAFAKILDFYQIPWQYEPRSFAIEWDAAGRPSQFFTPDFFLTDFDLYVELTTLRQPLVTKKNRKLRRLRECYPEVNVKLLYRRDVRALLGKYGVRVAANAS